MGRGLGREFEEGNGGRGNSVDVYTISLSRPSDVVQLDQGQLQSLMEPVHVSRGAKGQQVDQGKLQSLMEPVHVSRGAKEQQLEALDRRLQSTFDVISANVVTPT